MLPPSAALCLIGFGETASLFGAELAARGCAVRGYDPHLDDPATREAMQQRFEEAGVHPATLAEAVLGAKLIVFTAADEATAMVRRVAPLLQRGQIFLDLSGVAAAARQGHAQWIGASGADYVDAVLLASPMSQRLGVPMQLRGPRAAELAPALNALGFDARAASDSAGFERHPAASTPSPPPAAGGGRKQARRGELP